MQDLTPSQLQTLQNLAVEKTSALASFTNIADARLLTDLGLAERSRQGWNITAKGSAEVAERAGPAFQGPALWRNLE
jgi:hypothetical protein